MTSATLRQSEAEIVATIDRQCDRLARVTRQIGSGSHRLPALLADVERTRAALLRQARAEIAERACGGEERIPCIAARA